MAKAKDSFDVVYWLGNRSPRISRPLSSLVGAYEPPDGTIYRLRARSSTDSTVLLDKTMTMVTVDGAKQVYYDPVTADVIFSTEGTYKAWISLNIGGSGVTQDVEEFDLVVLGHSPGDAVRTGGIARRARQRAPIAWDALSNYRDFGDPGLQDLVELEKLRIFPASMLPITASMEDSLDLRVINYVALRVAIEVLKRGIEYWTSRIISQTTAGGPGEVQTYPDRIKAAQDLIGIYSADLATALAEAQAVLGIVLGTVSAGGITIVDGGEPITPGLSERLAFQLGYHTRPGYVWWCE